MFLKSLLFSVFILGGLGITPHFSDVSETTIVVVDGRALLVDVNEHGHIITTYMEVPEYFDSNKDHDTKVTEAKASYTRLTQQQMDQIRFIAVTENSEEVGDIMKMNLEDLANHYHQTYANQIQITAAKRKENNTVLEQNIQKIKNILLANDVSERDILVKYKIDLGEEPTQFIKVVSNLRSLPFE